MYKILINERDLSKRAAAIRSLLQVLLSASEVQLKNRSTVGSNTVKTAQNYIIGAFDGSKPSNEYRNWRFRSNRADFKCMYFEEWRPEDATRKQWFLQQICFSLFRIVNHTKLPQEILAIHCEPMEPNDRKHLLYKRGLHLHVTLATQPIPHAHFALNNGYLAQVMTSIETLSEALKVALIMVSDQVINNPDWD